MDNLCSINTIICIVSHKQESVACLQCSDGVSLRKRCRQGTWMGLPDLRYAGRKSMCRQRLPVDVDDDRCPQATDFDLCRNAKDIDTEAAHPKVRPGH